MRHFLKINDFSLEDSRYCLGQAGALKRERSARDFLLQGQTWGLIFSKSSTRTRVSFETGIHELGGRPMFLSANDIQLGRGEPIRDTARVLGRMIHGAVIRTYAQADVEEFAEYSQIPTINALTDDEHPCQILTDIFTYEEKRGPVQGSRLAFIGDADCNVARSFVHAADVFDFHLVCASPEPFQTRVTNSNVTCTDDPVEAARDADWIYTDVWVSMGKEAEAAQRLEILSGYQINHDLLRVAKKDALVLHCLPAYRGKEITEDLFEERAQDIFDQAENRLHVQKGILKFVSGS